MKNILLLLTVLMLSGIAFGQKVKTKNDTAYVDGSAFLVWKTSAYGKEISVSALNSNVEEIYISYLSYNDPSKVSNGNKDGSVSFIELNFLTLKKKFEIKYCVQNALVKFIIENKIYVDGVLNPENVEILVQKYGTRFSDSKPGNININVNNN